MRGVLIEMKSDADIKEMMRGVTREIMYVRRLLKLGSISYNDAESRVRLLRVKYDTLKSVVR